MSNIVLVLDILSWCVTWARFRAATSWYFRREGKM